MLGVTCLPRVVGVNVGSEAVRKALTKDTTADNPTMP